MMQVAGSAWRKGGGWPSASQLQLPRPVTASRQACHALQNIQHTTSTQPDCIGSTSNTLSFHTKMAGVFTQYTPHKELYTKDKN